MSHHICFKISTTLPFKYKYIIFVEYQNNRNHILRQDPFLRPQASTVPTQSSTSSQTPSLSASASHEPPHTPRESKTLPLQSQSPCGISAQPQSYIAPGPLQRPQASTVPTQSSTSSQTPSLSASSHNLHFGINMFLLNS